MRVGLVVLKTEQGEKEFFLYADETIIGSSPKAHFSLKQTSKSSILPEHLRIFRRKTGLWLEALVKDKETTSVNRRKVLGPVELLDGDTIELPDATLKFNIKDAC